MTGLETLATQGIDVLPVLSGDRGVSPPGAHLGIFGSEGAEAASREHDAHPHLCEVDDVCDGERHSHDGRLSLEQPDATSGRRVCQGHQG